MLSFRTINILLIIIGLALAVSAQTYEPKNQYLLIAGIVVIMIAIYRVSSKLSSKNKDEKISSENELDENFDESQLNDPSNSKNNISK